jgi:tight adherence protein C
MAPALAFLAAALAAAGIVLLVPPLPARRGRRRAGIHDRATGSRGERAAQRVLRGLASLAARIAPGRAPPAPRDLSVRIAAAGVVGLGPREVMGAKLAAAVAGGAGGSAMAAVAPGRLGILITLVSPPAGFLAPDLWLARRTAARARAVARELPAMLDLLRVTVEAGVSLQAALAAVGDRAAGPVAVEWRAASRAMALGVPLASALEEMTARLPTPEVKALVAAFERAARHGAPLAETLAAQAREARFARRRRIQEEAARAGPKIQLVVALLLVPSVLLLVGAALAAALIDSGGGLITP